MSATMARQGGRVQLEQSNMRLALNMPKMAKEGFSHATIEETQLIKKPNAKVWEEMKWGVVFPAHNKVNAVIQRHLAMVRENQMDGCLACQNRPANVPQTRWRRKGTGAPTPRQVPPRPGILPVWPDDREWTQHSEREGVRAEYVYIHTPLPSTRFFNLDPYAKDRTRNKDFIPCLPTDEGPSTG